MFTSNPFAALSTTIPTAAIQTYVIVMIGLVVAGTLFDIWHKRSATYFFDSWRTSRDKGTRHVGGGKMATLAIRTALAEGLTSAEFGYGRRRVAHLLTMYGFLLYVVTTVIMVFCYPAPATPTPAVLPQLWIAGALLVCVGGYWFWFFIRVDVAAEGHTPFRVMRADLFILSLLASVTLGLIWAGLQSMESAGRTCSWASTSSPRRCCSDPFRGPSSHTCSSSPRRPSRSGCPRRRVRGATCRPPPTNPKRSAAPANGPATTDRLIVDLP